MKKTTICTSLAIFLSALTISSFAQPPLESYSILSLKGAVIQDVLQTYPAFSFFDFTFKQAVNKNYFLVGYAMDNDSNQLGNQITLATISGSPARPLRNLEKGHLYLTRETMDAHNVDGSENYILTPKKCKDRSGELVDYVSYRFSNRVYNTSESFLPDAALISFDLNPSPPY